MIGEAGVDTYTSTAFSRSMGDESANVSNWVYTGYYQSSNSLKMYFLLM